MTTSRWHFATCCFLKLGVHSRGSCFQSRPGFRENCVPRRQSGRQQGSCTHEFNRIHGREQAWTLTNRFLRHPSRAVGCFPTSKWNRHACWQGAHVFSFRTGALHSTCNSPPCPPKQCKFATCMENNFRGNVIVLWTVAARGCTTECVPSYIHHCCFMLFEVRDVNPRSPSADNEPEHQCMRMKNCPSKNTYPATN